METMRPKQRRNLARMMMTFFLVLLSIFFLVVNITKPRILILHSYNLDFSWVVDINTGINRILEKYPYKIRWYYMDTKNHPDKAFMTKAGVTVRKEIKSWKPDIIIAIDDNAQEYAGKYYINHPNIKIVFTGVNKTTADYDYDTAQNITGMLERINYQATKDILVKVLPPEKRRIVHISDSSPTSEGIHDEIASFDWTPLTFTKSVQCKTFEQWQAAILEAENQADFILYTHYHTIQKSADAPEIMPPKQVIDWTMANSSLPGVSFWGFYVEDGGMMAVALSPFEQGEVAARMAVDIIENNTVPKDIPVETSRLFVMYMRESKIKEKMGQLDLPLVYEAFAKATNNYYK